MGARLLKYLETAVRDLASEGLIESKDHNVLACEIMCYITGVLMQAKIENDPTMVERLTHGVMRLLNVKQVATT
jgi:hypothetical protein